MVTSCVAFGCKYKHVKGSKVGVYRFPKNAARRKLWTTAVKRLHWEPTASSRICGKHFQTGKPNDDVNHPDYVPNLFTFCAPKSSVLLYEKRKKLLDKKRKNAEEPKDREEAASGLLLLQEVDNDGIVDGTVEYSKKQPHEMNYEEPSSISSRPEEINFDTEEIMDNAHGGIPMEEENSNDEQTQLQELKEKMKLMETKVSVLEKRVEAMGKEKEMMNKEMQLLRAEKVVLCNTVLQLNPTDSVLNDGKTLNLYTGLPSRDIFDWLVKISDNLNGDFVSKPTQILIVLMKLKCNLTSSDLAFRFKISVKSVQRIFDSCIPLLGEKLQPFIIWPGKKALRRNCPESFQNTEYKNTVCIIDCTEIPIERPGNLTARTLTWSNYKNSQTLKFLVAVTPSGFICFLSKTWGGRASDKEITLNCGFFDKIMENDLVLADRGFKLEEHFRAKGARLVVPSFTHRKRQLSKREVIFSKKLSNVRIHVERAIRQIKRFRLLQNKIPINFLLYIDQVITICAVLSNLSNPIVK